MKTHHTIGTFKQSSRPLSLPLPVCLLQPDTHMCLAAGTVCGALFNCRRSIPFLDCCFCQRGSVFCCCCSTVRYRIAVSISSCGGPLPSQTRGETKERERERERHYHRTKKQRSSVCVASSSSSTSTQSLPICSPLSSLGGIAFSRARCTTNSIHPFILPPAAVSFFC